MVQGIAHTKNRTYNSKIKMSPYEAITGMTPNISHIRVLGSLAYTLIPKDLRSKKGKLGKLALKANKGILLGFISLNNYVVYIPSEKTVINIRDIVIKEDLLYREDYIQEENEENFTSFLEESSHNQEIPQV